MARASERCRILIMYNLGMSFRPEMSYGVCIHCSAMILPLEPLRRHTEILMNDPRHMLFYDLRLEVTYCSKQDYSLISLFPCQSLWIRRCVIHKQCSTTARSKDSIYDGGGHKRNNKKSHATFLHTCGSFVTSGSQSGTRGTGTKHRLGRREQRQAAMQDQDQTLRAQLRLRTKLMK
jgi:hypothetical protein